MPLCTPHELPFSLDLSAWVDEIATRCGLEFGPTRVRRLVSGLKARLYATGMDPTSYWAHLNSDSNAEEEWQSLIEALVIGETRFFRHRPSFEFFEKVVLPNRLQVASRSGDFRILSAGCANGAEAYSLTMLALPICQAAAIHLNTVGFDISREAIAMATMGQYRTRHMRGLSGKDQHNYFRPTKEADLFEVKLPIKRATTFRQVNLLEPQVNLEGPYDVIFCHNLMIYFSHSHRQKLLSIFLNHLHPDGYIILGPAEVFAWPDPRLEKQHGEQTLVFKKSPSKQPDPWVLPIRKGRF